LILVLLSWIAVIIYYLLYRKQDNSLLPDRTIYSYQKELFAPTNQTNCSYQQDNSVLPTRVKNGIHMRCESRSHIQNILPPWVVNTYSLRMWIVSFAHGNRFNSAICSYQLSKSVLRITGVRRTDLFLVKIFIKINEISLM
jgi:hypothetical protein